MDGSKNKIISFELLQVNKNREKLCRCNPPHYEVDTVNRIVKCTDCGAIIDPFEALIEVANQANKYKEFQKEAIEKINIYREQAKFELRRRFRNKAFKDMDEEYKRGMFPHCPICDKPFDPIRITKWSNGKCLEKSNI